MNTPICDFVRSYAQSEALRLHMPGHKGASLLGMEPWDITEIDGADSLYEANGIIKESEKNASSLFGCATYYATEGASQCIRAMLYLAVLHAKAQGKKPIIAAGRNAHKAFVSAAALLDFDIFWLFPERAQGYLSCHISASGLEQFLTQTEEKPVAVYLTSPDYLGETADIRALSKVCKKHGVWLLVDNAHGAYLRFLPETMFPIDLGADMCCSSAHKTLPVLTGGAYLQLSEAWQAQLGNRVKAAMVLFGSTSPSYLILQSLDAANPYLEGHKERLAQFLPQVACLKKSLCDDGYVLCGEEPMKLTLMPKSRGYTGIELSQHLLHRGIVCEFKDRDYVVLMLSPALGAEGLKRLQAALTSLPPKAASSEAPPKLPVPEQVISPRQAALSLTETLPVEAAEGRILADTAIGCPPAVPIVVCGERIDRQAIKCFRYYGVERCAVIVEKPKN